MASSSWTCSVLLGILALTSTLLFSDQATPGKPSDETSPRKVYYDANIHNFVTERTCWWNEPCKKEFQRIFRCRCPDWAYCRSLGKYYAAHCSFTKTGYIWEQRQSNHSPRRPLKKGRRKH